MTVVLEAVANNDGAANLCHAVTISPGIACIGCACPGGLAQIKGLGLVALQTGIGNGNGVSVRSIAVFQLGIPGGAAHNSKANTGQFTVYQIIIQIQLYGGGSTSGDINQIGTAVTDTACIVVGEETNFDRIGGITQCGNQHIQAEVGVGFFNRRLGLGGLGLGGLGLGGFGLGGLGLCCIRNGFIHKEKLVAISEEAIGNGHYAIGYHCGTACVCIGITGAVLTAGQRSFAQINALIQLTLQADSGNSNVVSVGSLAVFQLGIPGRTAQNSKTDTGELAVYQIFAQIQLYSVGISGGYINSVNMIVDVAFKVVTIEADTDGFIVTAQGAHLHIQLNVCRYLVEGDLVAVSEDTVGKGNYTICQSYSITGICIGITGAVLTSCDCSITQINGTILRAFQAHFGDLDGVSVGSSAVFQRGIPGRTAENRNADALELAVYQVLALIQLHGIAHTCGHFNSVGIVIDIAFEIQRIEAKTDGFKVTAPCADLHIHADLGLVGFSSLIVAVSSFHQTLAVIIVNIVIGTNKVPDGCITNRQCVAAVGNIHGHHIAHILRIDAGSLNVVQAILFNRIYLRTVNGEGIAVYAAICLKIEAHSGLREEANGSAVETDAFHLTLGDCRGDFIRNRIAGLNIEACVGQIADIVIEIQLCPRTHIQQFQTQILGGLAVIAIDDGYQVVTNGVVLVKDLLLDAQNLGFNQCVDIIRHLCDGHLHRQIIHTVFVGGHIIQRVGCGLACVGDCSHCVLGIVCSAVGDAGPQVQYQVFTQGKLLGNVVLALQQSCLCTHRNDTQE